MTKIDRHFQKEISGDETLTQAETDSLTDIAWQTAWEGGDAVFDARRMLMLEVDDQENNLRIAHRPVTRLFLNFIVERNPSNGKVNFHGDPSFVGELRVMDIYGKEIFLKEFVGGRATIPDLNAGIYFAQLLQNGNILNAHKFVVIK